MMLDMHKIVRLLAITLALAVLQGCASLYFHDAGTPPSPLPNTT